MPEILRPTNPVPGYDSAGSRNQPINPQDPNTNIQNVVDPNRVLSLIHISEPTRL